jgi:hypothetical protein
MLLYTRGLKIKKMQLQRDILKGKPIDWYHFRPLLILPLIIYFGGDRVILYV